MSEDYAAAEIGGVEITPGSPVTVASAGSMAAVERVAEDGFLQGVTDLLEVRCDELLEYRSPVLVLERLQDVNELLDGEEIPVIVSARTGKRGGEWPMDAEDRRRALYENAARYVDAVEIDDRSYGIIDDVLDAAEEHGAATIVAHYNDSSTPSGKMIEQRLHRMDGHDPDVKRLEYLATDGEDVERLRSVVEEYAGDVPLAARSTGAAGSGSGLRNAFSGSAMIYGEVGPDRAGPYTLPETAEYLDRGL